MKRRKHLNKQNIYNIESNRLHLDEEEDDDDDDVNNRSSSTTCVCTNG